MNPLSNKLARPLAMISLFMATIGAADAKMISGQVVDVQGQPTTNAIILQGDKSYRTNELGEYSIDLPAGDVYQLHVSAPGYYSFIHTFSRADLTNNAAGQPTLTIPPITLIAKKENRRLLVFAGDTMMGRRFVEPRDGEPALIRAATAGKDTDSILEHIRPYFELADFASVNLETQLSDSMLTEPLPKSVTFFTTEHIATALSRAGVDYTALGNNHMFDYGAVGLTKTIAALKHAGLGYSGAGASDALARRPYTTTIDGQRLDLLSYVGWPGGFKPNQVAATNKGGAALGTSMSIAADLDPLPDDSISILQYHSGLEYVSHPPLAEETQLKLAIDRGADLAIGHHSHVFQGFEVYKRKLIAYSLGNFIFDQYLYSTQSAILLFTWYDGDEFYRAEIVPLHINGYVPTPASGGFRYDIIQRLARLSDPATVCWSRSGGHAAFRQCSSAVSRAEPQEFQIAIDATTKANSIVSLRSYDAEPHRPVGAVHAAAPYRLGLDILRRGDFEYFGLFGTRDRTWMEDDRLTIHAEESMLMDISVPRRDTVKTGMKVFTRVFTRSNPATVSGKIRSSGCTNARFYLQRRRDGMSFTEALADGPVSPIGQTTTAADGWSSFAIDFKLPRTATRGIRLLMDFENCSEADISIQLDDLALLEWQTPWLPAGEDVAGADQIQATHLQHLVIN